VRPDQTGVEQEARVPRAIRLCAAIAIGSLLSGACSASTTPSKTAESADTEATGAPVAENTPGIITTIAGNGFAASAGDGGPAMEASLEYPNVLGFDNEGNLYVSDGATRVRRIDPSGIITTVVGPGAGGKTAGVGQAASVLGRGKGIDADGNLYVATSVKGGDEQSMLVKVTPSGQVSTLAGTGHSGFSGDGGPGDKAQLSSVYGRVAVDTDGNVYFADFDNNRVRKVDAEGIITTIVGTGEAGYSGDGGPARDARIDHPTCVSLDPQGNLLVAEGGERHRIRMVDSAGIITTVVRNGRLVDGTGPAADKLLSGYVWADDTGNLYLVDEGRPRVLRVDAEGTAIVIAGTGKPGYSGDGGPATQAQLNEPIMAIVGPDGAVYIADAGNNLIRRVESSGE
jgi:sugar lactone lactonase YvrE